VKYRIEIEFDGWFGTDVHASSEKEAREKALAALYEECEYVSKITQFDVIDDGDEEEEACEQE
jgi:hypothetical protein